MQHAHWYKHFLILAREPAMTIRIVTDSTADLEVDVIRGYGIVDALGASQAAPPAPGDLNEDGAVDIVDFLALLGSWGPCPAPCPPHCFGDVDTDCIVGINDLLALLANWG